MHVAPVITPSRDLQDWLRKQVGSVLTPKGLVERCRIVLLAAQGQEKVQIAASLGHSRHKCLFENEGS